MDRLIATVKSTPCLWDTNDPAYKDYETMERAWSQVAEDLGYPDGKYAKMQWKKLRDNFREALKRQSDRQKRSKRTVKEWRFRQQMEFLVPYMQSRGLDFMSNISDSATDESLDVVVQNSDTMTIPVVFQVTESKMNSSQNFNKVRQTPEADLDKKHQDSEADTKISIPHILEVFHCPEVPQGSGDKRQRTHKWGENDEGPDLEGRKKKMKDSSVVLYDSKETRQSSCVDVKKGDALLDFFSSMYNTTSRLSPQMQLRVKRKIFEIVTEAEESSFLVKKEPEEYDE